MLSLSSATVPYSAESAAIERQEMLNVNGPKIVARNPDTSGGTVTKTYCDPLDYLKLLSTFYEPPKPDNSTSKVRVLYIERM